MPRLIIFLVFGFFAFSLLHCSDEGGTRRPSTSGFPNEDEVDDDEDGDDDNEDGDDDDNDENNSDDNDKDNDDDNDNDDGNEGGDDDDDTPDEDGNEGNEDDGNKDDGKDTGKSSSGNGKGICGDGELTEDEECDDGNTDDGDGCRGDCLEVTEGYSCAPPGMPCHRMAKCGDGHPLLPEMCDDGNTKNGDGCSSLCKIEIGYKCEGEPSDCSETTCGDGKMEGAETCDDGNVQPFDGCNSICQAEPQCKVGQACTSACGDGLVLGAEECDDGNGISGDGCSDDCKVEDGFECEQGELGEEMTVPIILRDFNASDDDFEYEAEEEGDIAYGLIDATEDLVEQYLSDDKKPVFARAAASGNALVANGLINSPESFDKWYRNPPDEDATVISELILFDDDGDGDYVNRYEDNGDMWERLDEEYEGNPVFFPLDDLGITPSSDYAVARIPPNYFGLPDGSEVDDTCNLGEGCNPCWPPECVTGDSWDNGDCVDGDAGETLEDYDCYSRSPEHNFHFTSQVGYWFQYDQSNDYRVSFVGDDDLWVFVNGELVLDLGGIHTALHADVDIGRELNLVDGEVYEIMVFHAERQTYASTYRLTLSGFDTSRSECVPDCGDGILALGEECDDGVNDGGYGECGPNCKLDSYCGDGEIQKEHGETCDDGNFINDDACPSSCRIVVLI